MDIDVIDGARGAGSLGSGGSSSGRANASKYYGGSGKSVDSTLPNVFKRMTGLRAFRLDPTKFRFDIEVYVPNPDDVVIAPERVWRDDIFTYIDLGEKALNMTPATDRDPDCRTGGSSGRFPYQRAE